MPVAVIITASFVVGIISGGSDTVTDGICVSISNSPTVDPIEQGSTSVWPDISILVRPLIFPSIMLNEYV